METTTNGTPAPVEQAQPGIQQLQEQPNQQQPPAAPAGTTPEYTPQQIAEWQQKAQEADKLQDQYRHLQADYTRKSQALAQLSGVNPQQPNDPFSDVVEWAKTKGYDVDTARGIAEMADLVATKRTNAAMQSFAYQNVGNQIPLVMNQAWQQAPAAFGNPKVQESVQNELMRLAQEGQFQLITPAYAASFAKIAAFDNGYAPPVQQQQANSNPFAQGMFGIPQGFQNTQVQQKQESPIVQKVTSEIDARYGKPKQ